MQYYHILPLECLHLSYAYPIYLSLDEYWNKIETVLDYISFCWFHDSNRILRLRTQLVPCTSLKYPQCFLAPSYNEQSTFSIFGVTISLLFPPFERNIFTECNNFFINPLFVVSNFPQKLGVHLILFTGRNHRIRTMQSFNFGK